MKNFFSTIIAIAVAVMFSSTLTPVHAEDTDLSKEDKACLSCHDKEGVFKVLEIG